MTPVVAHDPAVRVAQVDLRLWVGRPAASAGARVHPSARVPAAAPRRRPDAPVRAPPGAPAPHAAASAVAPGRATPTAMPHPAPCRRVRLLLGVRLLRFGQHALDIGLQLRLPCDCARGSRWRAAWSRPAPPRPDGAKPALGAQPQAPPRTSPGQRLLVALPEAADRRVSRAAGSRSARGRRCPPGNAARFAGSNARPRSRRRAATPASSPGRRPGAPSRPLGRRHETPTSPTAQPLPTRTRRSAPRAANHCRLAGIRYCWLRPHGR